MSEYCLKFKPFKPKIFEMKLYKLFAKIIGRGIPLIVGTLAMRPTAQVSEQEA